MSEAIPLWETLPEEIWCFICAWLHQKDLAAFALVNHTFHRITEEDSIWKVLYRKEYESRKQRDSTFSWDSRTANWEHRWQKMNQSVGIARRTMLDFYRAPRRWTSAPTIPRSFLAHKGEVDVLQFDDEKIVTGSSDRTVCVFDANTFEKKRKRSTCRSECVAYSTGTIC